MALLVLYVLAIRIIRIVEAPVNGRPSHECLAVPETIGVTPGRLPLLGHLLRWGRSDYRALWRILLARRALRMSWFPCSALSIADCLWLIPSERETCPTIGRSSPPVRR